jgi:hypothetical protein
MNRTWCVFAFAILLAARPTAAVAASCPATADPPVEVVYAAVNLWEGNALQASFGADAQGRQIVVPMVKDEVRWYVDLAKVTPLVPATMPLSELETRFKPWRPGWSFLPRPRPTFADVALGGATRCAAFFAADAIAIWRVHVSAKPQTFSVRVVCPRNLACRPNSATDFDTNAVGARDPIAMDVDLGICRYPVSIAPHEVATLPLVLSRRDLASGCTGWQYFLYTVNPARLRVPPDGMVIEILEKASP